MLRRQAREVDKRAFLISVADKLKDREVSHLIFLARGVILSREVTDQVHTFLELIDAMEKHNKIDEAMKDWQVLYDILDLVKRNDLVKTLKDFGTKYRRSRMTRIDLSFNPIQSLEGPQPELEISEQTVSLKDLFQPGEYSDLWKGTVKSKKNVIVEVYKAQSSNTSAVLPAFLQSRLKHENIVEVLKIIRKKEPPWIVLEWLPHGDLQTFLRSGNPRRLTSIELIGFATQIAKGMRYLEDNQYAHCSLMTSNIFLGYGNVVKIGGFSLARKLGEAKIYDLGEDVRLSVRWCAPEVILYRQVTKKSDVWSFGIVLVEMFSRGAVPYQGIENSDLLPKFRSGYRHPKPKECPDGIYRIMTLCWNIQDDPRPSFKELMTVLENYKESNDYSDLPLAPTPTSPSVRKSSVYINDPPVVAASGNEDPYVICSSRNTLLPGEMGHEGGSISLPRVAPALPSPPAWVKEVEIPRDSIKFMEQLGSGEFGEVWRAELPDHQHVAVKKFIPPKLEPGKFLEEAEMMKKFNHPHLISLIGICAKELPILIVTELMALGSLLQFLRYDAGVSLLTHTLLSYAAQVADAMSYIEQMKCIHRDIAARNVLMRDRTTVKLSDFGLSRTLESSYYEAKPDARFPVRWTAPEAANFRKYSIKSDVWAFGILLIELVTYGMTPYPEMNNNEVLINLRKGYKHPQPESCPDDIYEVMISCWRKTENRPSFKELLNTVKRLRDSHAKDHKGLSVSESSDL